MSIKFKIIPNGSGMPTGLKSTAVLVEDNWDDWFKFSTMYYLWVFDSKGEAHEIGHVKIGELNMKGRRPLVSPEFMDLNSNFFSLGQDTTYYQSLYNLGSATCNAILKSLRDVVQDHDILNLAINEEVTGISLLRSVSITSIKGQFKRLISGGKRVTRFKFKYELAQSRKVAGVSVDFDVIPDSNPPTNIHVLIGRNGVGKTHLLNNMVRALVDEEADIQNSGQFLFEDDFESDGTFSKVISVSFSAFDPFDPLPEKRDKSKGVQYSYVGLKRTTNIGGKRGSPKSPQMLTNEFVSGVVSCKKFGKFQAWMDAVTTLESDPLFKDAGLSTLMNVEDEFLELQAKSIFQKLSSGHRIILLTLTNLIQAIEEKTLVLLDEPEAHLHPPLLSAFTRAISDLLSYVNGVAIIATHSPVIIQEVPKSCVWKLRRSGYEACAERPLLETFGENVGILTREIFGLEVSHSGFHKLLESNIEVSESFDEVMTKFRGQLGAEARAIARSLMASRQLHMDDEL